MEPLQAAPVRRRFPSENGMDVKEEKTIARRRRKTSAKANNRWREEQLLLGVGRRQPEGDVSLESQESVKGQKQPEKKLW